MVVEDPTSWGSSVAAIIAATATFLTALGAFLSSLRNAKKAAAIEAKVTRSDEKLDVVTTDVKLVVQHTNSMKDDLMAATKDLATLREKERNAAEAATAKAAQEKALANGIEAERRGAQAERDRRDRGRHGGDDR